MVVSCKLRGSRLVAPSASVLSGPAVRSALIASGHSPTFPSPFGQCCRCCSVWIGLHVSTFLHPFAPPALPGFIATMSALTPAWRRDAETRSAPRGGRYLESFLLLRHAGLLASRVPSLQSLPSPTTPLPPMTALSPTPQRHGIPVRTGRGFAFRPQARQSAWPNRVCFRYGRPRSPSVAPHPASRRRSYGWLQASVGLPEEDLHLLEQNALASARSPGQAGR
jgi:hypothetical protein